jgi:hypothetical protein
MTAISEEDQILARDSGGAGGSNGNGHVKPSQQHANDRSSSVALAVVPARARTASSAGNVPSPLVLLPGAHTEADEEETEIKGHGLRGWLRALKVGRVLGTLSLYLFLQPAHHGTLARGGQSAWPHRALSGMEQGC